MEMKSKSFQFELHRTRDRETVKRSRRDENQKKTEAKQKNLLALHKN